MINRINVKRLILLAFLLLLIRSESTLKGQQVTGDNLEGVGDLIPDFVLKDTQTGKLVSRSDFAGGILVLDFFAHWCGPCQASTPGLKQHIEEYYRNRNGNPSGLPVYIVSINVDTSIEERQHTLNYIQDFQLEIVLEDFTDNGRDLFDRFPNKGGIPYFAIVNTIDNSPDYKQWELLYFNRGFRGNGMFIEEFQPKIDSVTSVPADPEPKFLKSPANVAVPLDNPLTLRSRAVGQNPLVYHWYKDGVIIPDANRSTLHLPRTSLESAGTYYVEVTNDLGNVQSEEAQVKITHSFDDYTEIFALRSENAKPTSDPDNDGKNNLYEFLMRSKPNDPNDRGIPEFTTSLENQSIEITYHINAGATGVQYQLFYSVDLLNWNELAPELIKRSKSTGAFDTVNVSLPFSDVANGFLRLEVLPPQFDGLTIQSNETVQGEITEDDLVNNFYLNDTGEIFYEDFMIPVDLNHGTEYTLIIQGDANSSYYPWVDLYIDDFSGTVASMADNHPTPYYTKFSFIANQDIDYRFGISSFNAEAVGSYTAILQESMTLEKLPYNQVIDGEISETLDDFIHVNSSDTNRLDSYLLEGLPVGEEVSLILETIDNEEGLKAPSLLLENANTRENILSSKGIWLTDAGFAPNTEIPFIPDADTQYIAAVESENENGVGKYTLRVEPTDQIPTLRPGNIIQSEVDQDITWTFDDEEYYISFYKLTDVEADKPVELNITSEDALDVRIFVMNAADWTILFKDTPTEKGNESETFIVPDASKRYLIGAGVPVREEPTSFTLKATQEN